MLNRYYKERDFVKEILNKKRAEKGIKSELRVLAKYYKELGDKPLVREEKLYEYCNTKGKSWFKEVLHYKLIDGAINHSRKKENVIVQINQVDITLNEINFIHKLELEELEKKILFGFLVIDKLKKEKMRVRRLETDKNKNNHYFGGSGEFSYKTLLDSLHVTLPRSFRQKGIHTTIKKFNDTGLTRTAQKASVELLFIDNIEECNEIAIEINDFDRIGLYYDQYFNPEKIKKCELCGILIRAYNTRKYCETCRKEKELEKHKKYNQKRKFTTK